VRLFRPFRVPVGTRDWRFGSRDSTYPGINIPKLFKIVHGYYDPECVSYRQPRSYCNYTRGHNRKLFKLQSHLDLRKNGFTVTVFSNWNSLPVPVCVCFSMGWTPLKSALSHEESGPYLIHGSLGSTGVFIPNSTYLFSRWITAISNLQSVHTSAE